MTSSSAMTSHSFSRDDDVTVVEINGLKLTNSEYERTETDKGDLRWCDIFYGDNIYGFLLLVTPITYHLDNLLLG